MIASIYFPITMMLAIVSTSQGFQSSTTPVQTLGRRYGISVVGAVSRVPPSSASTVPSRTTSLERIFGRGNKNEDDDDALLPGKKMTKSRRKKLIVNDDEEEYDLGMALDNSSDPCLRNNGTRIIYNTATNNSV
jgi:hypothetical protein